ncbi:Gfo/Idh/MocA family oxidoreductase [Citricoccus sp. SGAir0253]|uniref:Gfo/Idh/MocA family protein n=1 Tax=Citricoccus sp. SGAir0253 TaxID=2567881 RepID=UPI0010CCDA08|nr:Gfo/Idh/MocA family oxidoreductase [Citricoccus sp. SGAir0253]QCU77555.1 Gfo/Idh/MocA family oxidoreductase [Citricoccus sp. SGAir0253]
MMRVGLIGLGMMGRHHARVLQHLDGVELAAVSDPGGDVHGAAPGVPLYPDVAGLIGHGVDAAVCAVPTALHEPVGMQLAEAGIHAFIEKPIAADVASGQRLVDAFASRGLVGAVGHIERFNPALQELKRRLDAGDLGKIHQIATRRQGPFPGRITDVGVARDLGTHDLDLTMWLGGDRFAEIDSQSAILVRDGREDLIAITGRLRNDVITNHLVNWLSPMKERVTTVTGEAGAFVADTLTADLTFYENGSVETEWEALANFRGVKEGNITRFAFPKPEPLKTELEAFRDAIRSGAPGIVTLEDGLHTLRAAEAVINGPSVSGSFNGD